jgi:hypothetical protein
MKPGDPFIEEQSLRPCCFMHGSVQRMAEGSALGWFGWYARMHLARCRRCQQALQAMRQLRDRLRQMGQVALPTGETLTPERQIALEAALDALEPPRSER